VTGGVRGLFFGDGSQLIAQLIALAVLLVFGFGGSYAFFKILDRVWGCACRRRMSWRARRWACWPIPPIAPRPGYSAKYLARKLVTKVGLMQLFIPVDDFAFERVHFFRFFRPEGATRKAEGASAAALRVRVQKRRAVIW